MSKAKLNVQVEELGKKVNQVLEAVSSLANEESKEGSAYRDYLAQIAVLRTNEMKEDAPAIELNKLFMDSPLDALVLSLANKDLETRGTLTQIRQRTELHAAITLAHAG